MRYSEEEIQLFKDVYVACCNAGAIVSANTTAQQAIQDFRRMSIKYEKYTPEQIKTIKAESASKTVKTDLDIIKEADERR